jgi:multiple sugar transport system substrate-binding protein
MFKKALAVVAVAAMTASMAACTGGNESSQSSGSGSNAPSGQKVELEYWFEGAGPERTPISEAIINSFNEQSETTKVTGLYVDLANVRRRSNVAWAGGSMPDMIYAQDSWMSDMFIQGMCLDLTEQFDAWDQKDQFDTTCVDAIKLKAADGKLYAIPTASNLSGIWYRKDIFKENSLEAPTTWDNYFTAIEKLTDKANNIWPHLRGGSGSANQLLYQIVSYVGEPDFFDADGNAVILRSPWPPSL